MVRIVWGHSGGESGDYEGQGLPTADDLEIPLPPVHGGRLRRASTPPVFGPELLDHSKVIDAPPPGDVVNITFRTPSEELDARFVADADQHGLSGLKGHRSVGGMRASIYNAFPRAGCEVLAQFMKDFAAKNG